jgi:hypothetical protein
MHAPRRNRHARQLHQRRPQLCLGDAMQGGFKRNIVGVEPEGHSAIHLCRDPDAMSDSEQAALALPPHRPRISVRGRQIRPTKSENAMRNLALSFLLLIATAFATTAQQARDPAIESTIRQQFDAFLAEDVTTAFSFASPNIKGIFGTPEQFGAMVKNGYPMVWHPSDVRFLELREVAGGLWQRVMVTDQAGRTHVLDYQMIKAPEGWQINAVQLLPQAGVGA